MMMTHIRMHLECTFIYVLWECVSLFCLHYVCVRERGVVGGGGKEKGKKGEKGRETVTGRNAPMCMGEIMI